jgi:hypothetical protein
MGAAGAQVPVPLPRGKGSRPTARRRWRTLAKDGATVAAVARSCVASKSAAEQVTASGDQARSSLSNLSIRFAGVSRCSVTPK